jgi:hypothetical protein
MKVLTKLLLAAMILTGSSFAAAQTSVESETFNSAYLPTKTGAQISFIGKSHSFSINLTGKVAKTQAVQGGEENQNFFYLDNKVVQTSLVPLQLPLPDGYKVGDLTTDQQKEILNGYVDYELDYFNQELHAQPKNVKREWVVINSVPFLIWYFNFQVKQPDPQAVKSFTGQIYMSAICFNQVLDINMPIDNRVIFDPSKVILEKIAATLKTYNQRLAGK